METSLIFWKVKGAGKSAPSLGSVLICRREQDLIERLTSCIVSVLIFKGEQDDSILFESEGLCLAGILF